MMKLIYGWLIGIRDASGVIVEYSLKRRKTMAHDPRLVKHGDAIDADDVVHRTEPFTEPQVAAVNP
jgi:hypothetical protein